MNTMALNFDTLQYAKRLQNAGFTEQQAEVQAEALKEQAEFINDWVKDNLATKRDLNEMGYKLTIRLGSMIAGAVIILGVLMPIMLKFLSGH